MKEYVATVNSYGYLGRYWREGDLLEWQPGMPPPPRHFRAVDGKDQKDQEPAPQAKSKARREPSETN